MRMHQTVFSPAQPAVTAALAAMLLLAAGGAGAHCKPNHPQHCDDPPPPPPGDRIGGCVVFNAGPIEGDGGTYEDGLGTTDHLGQPTSMQVAMNCSFNQFNVRPGGGDRRVRLDLTGRVPGPGLLTSIDRCDDPIYFLDTSTMDSVLCPGDPDNHEGWGFDQLMRSANSAINVCDLTASPGPSSTTARLRFQNNLHRQSSCKGGSKKCGDRVEAIEVNYGDDPLCAEVDIRCTADSGDTCSMWEIEATGKGCLTHENGSGQQDLALPFKATFTAGSCPS